MIGSEFCGNNIFRRMNQESELACCAVCRKETQRRCSRCLSIYYCNTDHQRQDWKRHKSECLPKLTKPESKSVISGDSGVKGHRNNKKIEDNTFVNHKFDEKLSIKEEEKRLRKSKKKSIQTEGKLTNSISPLIQIDSTDKIQKNSASSAVPTVTTAGNSRTSVISSVVYTNKDLTKQSAITHEGSSEQEILSETAQHLSSVDFATSSSSNVIQSVNRTDSKMPVLPEQPPVIKEYPEASLKGSGAPFSHMPNSYYLDPSDPSYDICQRVIRDMTQYGVCVLDNFLGKERGLLVLNEVLKMYRAGIFKPGQLVSSPNCTETQTIRSDRITWIDGKETHCYYIKQLISQVDNIILRANKMPNNGKMGDYVINGRTKAMVACYPGSGAHYVKHVDNPNKDGRCITAIYYLNLDWDVKRCGGLLRVFPEGTNQVADIAPIFDRMLFFWSDRRNPHEVQPAHDTRYAITLWYFDTHEREIALRKFSGRSQPSSSK